MKKEHYDIYFADRFQLEIDRYDEAADEITEGSLIPLTGSGQRISIIRGIPRFVNSDNYAEGFGLQWNTFRSTQLDSSSGLSLTADRLWKNTKWKPSELKGKRVLEAGSGAGRFTEIFLQAGAQVVSFDYSVAVDANRKNNSAKGDLLLFQGDMLDMPLADKLFDYVFCYGVLQHTPDPEKAYRCLFDMLEPGGKLAVDIYLKSRAPSPWRYPKYLWRPITKRLRPETLLRIVKWYIPRWLPVDTFVRRLPKVGRIAASFLCVPCWNYLNIGLSERQRVEWAIMDTFDALAPTYDIPKTLQEVQRLVSSTDNERDEVFYGGNGVVANVVKSPL